MVNLLGLWYYSIALIDYSTCRQSMQTFVLKERKETEYVMNAKQPYRTPEGDMCDLDPNKICDNCMKCVNKNGADYTEILADFDPESIRVFTPGDDEDYISEPIEQLDIDP